MDNSQHITLTFINMVADMRDIVEENALKKAIILKRRIAYLITFNWLKRYDWNWKHTVR